MLTRGPIHVIELIAETKPRQITAPATPAVRPKNMFTRDQRYFESTFQSWTGVVARKRRWSST